MDIAVIGSGVSGLTAAYYLSRAHRVEVFEQADYPGGHAHTVDAPAAGGGKQPVDTGFIVYNERNYPGFTRLLKELDVETLPSDMSFGVHAPAEGFAFSSRGVGGLLATARNAWSPSFYRMVRDILRFNREALEALENDDAGAQTLGEFLQTRRYSDAFIQRYITPMSSAIWSAPPGKTWAFPALTFFRFFKNHGLLSVAPNIPWRTVKGGSRSYVERIIRPFADHVHLRTTVREIHREADRVRIGCDEGPDRFFDRVVIAVHADQALRMLADPSDDEARLLRCFPYQTNRVALHSDADVMPRARRAWASWTVKIDANDTAERPLAMHYHMNRLQQIAGPIPYFVTLNPDPVWLGRAQRGGANTSLHFETDYAHPAYGKDSFRRQPDLSALSGTRNTYYCGAYLGYGFHEDGLQSGLAVAQALGVDGRS